MDLLSAEYVLLFGIVVFLFILNYGCMEGFSVSVYKPYPMPCALSDGQEGYCLYCKGPLDINDNICQGYETGETMGKTKEIASKLANNWNCVKKGALEEDTCERKSPSRPPPPPPPPTACFQPNRMLQLPGSVSPDGIKSSPGLCTDARSSSNPNTIEGRCYNNCEGCYQKNNDGTANICEGPDNILFGKKCTAGKSCNPPEPGSPEDEAVNLIIAKAHDDKKCRTKAANFDIKDPYYALRKCYFDTRCGSKECTEMYTSPTGCKYVNSDCVSNTENSKCSDISYSGEKWKELTKQQKSKLCGDYGKINDLNCIINNNDECVPVTELRGCKNKYNRNLKLESCDDATSDAEPSTPEGRCYNNCGGCYDNEGYICKKDSDIDRCIKNERCDPDKVEVSTCNCKYGMEKWSDGTQVCKRSPDHPGLSNEPFSVKNCENRKTKFDCEENNSYGGLCSWESSKLP